jgi:hypothetical protein
VTARGTWKAAERRCAADLQGRRIPVTGIDRDGADVESSLFCVQVKLRASLPAWLWSWLDGIRGTAIPKGKIGILLLKRPRQADVDGLVVLAYGDFVDLVGKVPGA